MQDWITREISSGLQKLVLLNLDHAPAYDVLSRGTLPAWVEAITTGRALVEKRDAPRLREAFRRLMATCTRWPTPRELLDAMPALPGPPPVARLDSDDGRRRGMEALAAIAKRMGWDREDAA
jgi:hypothetical protein